jgi:hypothetical protein
VEMIRPCSSSHIGGKEQDAVMGSKETRNAEPNPLLAYTNASFIEI